MYANAAADDMLPLVQQAQVLAMQFDAVVANPPYMGKKSMTNSVKDFAAVEYKDGKSDTFSMFMMRCQSLCAESGRIGLMTPFVWMFLSSYEELRANLITSKAIASLVQPQYHTFFESAAVPICIFIIDNSGLESVGTYFDLTEEYGADIQSGRLLEAIRNPAVSYMHIRDCRDFSDIPGSPVAYWAESSLRQAFRAHSLLKDIADVRQGLATSDNAKFVRYWHEVSVNQIGFDMRSRPDAVTSQKVWFPFNKGGAYRKWYGNFQLVVNWRNDGEEIKESILRKYPYLNGNPDFVAKNPDFYFREGLSWSALSSSDFSLRRQPAGFIFADKGQAMFPDASRDWREILGVMNSKVAKSFLQTLSPTLDFNAGYIAKVPIAKSACDVNTVQELVNLHERDWNSFESAWAFQAAPLITKCPVSKYLSTAFNHWVATATENRIQAKAWEEKTNDLVIKAYGLQDKISPEVSEEKITLTLADREKDSQRLISYAVGCMMGRYSLDEPGLIYAHAGNIGFEPGRYATFPADADGIVPITDELWFADDAPSRIREFLRAVWGTDTLDENMAWLAESLGTKATETPDESIRRYIADKFFKDHLQTYKKRPIYWLFSSGKQGAFQALVYLHRYSESTLSRMRAEYVVPLTGKIQNRIEMLQKDAAAANSTASRNKLAKEVEKLKKKHVELLAYDEQLRHYADMRITLDLDDGVKVNYGKFGDLLDSVRLVTGGASDE
jgi:hypothetical protein